MADGEGKDAPDPTFEVLMDRLNTDALIADTDALLALIAAELFKHRLTVGEDGRSQCTCGWWVAPLLESVHRLHQADAILAVTLMATAQIHGEEHARITERYRRELEECRQQLLST
jgi:hypothetical protein